MTPNTLGLISACAYLISSGLLIRDTLSNKPPKFTIITAWFAVLLHFAYTFSLFQQQQYINFSLFNTASMTCALVSLLLLLANINKPVEKLGIAIFPIASLAIISNLFFSGQAYLMEINNWQMSTHILSSVIAFSLLNIAALQAILLAIQDQQLRKHPPRRFIQSLPALETMEALLFQMIATGILFLSVSLVSGFIFIEDLFAQQLAHKTILSLIAWITFSSLLVGRYKYGWRGQTAVRWTLAGFCLLLLAYFGSKFVLQLILNRV